jgi:hypothetical protein
VLLDTGILYIGASIFSAQEGGLKFDPGKTLRNVEFDGKRTDIKALDRTVMFAPKLAGTILEFSAANIPNLEPGASAATVTGSPSGFTTGYQPKAAGVLYAAGDYLSNVRAIWQRGDGTYVQVRFMCALVSKWDLQGTDKQEGKVQVELDARLDMSVTGAHTSDPPYVIEYFTVSPQA